MSQKPEHCFWLGQLEGGVFRGYEPCAPILRQWGTGVVVIEVGLTPAFPDQPPLSREGAELMFPTGNWVVLNRESEMFQHLPNPDEVKSAGKMFVDPELYNLILDTAKGVEPACNQSKQKPY